MLLIILVDQSGSMEERAGAGDVYLTKAEYLVRVINTLITEFIFRCRREEGIRNYFDLEAIGYSNNEVRSLLSRNFSTVTPSALALLDRPRRSYSIERRLPNGGTTICGMEETLWIAPRAEGNTPMYAALSKAHGIASGWCSRKENRNSYPPVVINISDGEATDAGHRELLSIAERIRRLSTTDGNALLMNIHISGEGNSRRAIFPCDETELPEDRNARLLYRMSSTMPAPYEQMIREVRADSRGVPPFRGMGYNTPVTELVTMLNIGSISVDLME